MRMLELPEDMQNSLSEGKISEGHTRPLLMLCERPEEQRVLFQDIILRKLNVRDAETAARKVAVERVRKWKADIDPELLAMEERFAESLGTKVLIEKKDKDASGKLVIEFFSNEDLEGILNKLQNTKEPPIDDRTPEEIKIAEDTPIEEDLYSIKNFSI